MATRDWIVLILTALMGFIAGVYMYTVVFSPVYVSNEPVLATDPELTIIGEMYGGCARLGCPSFRLTSDREYQYLPSGAATDTGPVTGVYPRIEWRALEELIMEADLAFLASPTNPTNCDSFVDGVDYRYQITRAGTTYELATCGTRIRSDSEVQRALEKIFRVLADPAAFSYLETEYQTAGVIGYIFPELIR